MSSTHQAPNDIHCVSIIYHVVAQILFNSMLNPCRFLFVDPNFWWLHSCIIIVFFLSLWLISRQEAFCMGRRFRSISLSWFGGSRMGDLASQWFVVMFPFLLAKFRLTASEIQSFAGQILNFWLVESSRCFQLEVPRGILAVFEPLSDLQWNLASHVLCWGPGIAGVCKLFWLWICKMIFLTIVIFCEFHHLQGEICPKAGLFNIYVFIYIYIII